MIPKHARPHEVAILLFYLQGFNPKQIAHELHYEKPQPVRRVIRKWKMHLELVGSS